MKQFDSFRLDISNECVWRDGVQLALPPKPFAVLRYLVENPGRLITHDELLDALWPETYVQPQVLRTYILELRKLLGDDAGQPRFIQTLPKRGYCFVAPVRELGGSERVATQATFVRDQKSTSVVGREQELACLSTHLGMISDGNREVVFISGEAGIGKTALVDAFCGELDLSSKALVARGQCVEGFGGKEEYYPVMEALNQLCASPNGERACGVLAKMAPAWLGTPGRGLELSAHSSARTAAEERMPGDICGALEELSQDEPLILIFEDVHWADASTLHLISALGRRRAKAKLMVVVTYRPHVMAMEHPLRGTKQDLLMRRLCIEIVLTPLNKKAISELLCNELQQIAPPPGLAGFVHQHSEGNPLFAIAILEHLIAQKFLVRGGSEGEQGWEQRAPFQEMEAGVPDGLAQMIEFEIERLSPEEQCMLEAGSLMSVAFPAWAVAAALDKDMAETEEACDSLARRLYFLERAGQDELPDGGRSAFYVFAHGLYREVLYQRQAVPRRARRHMRIAERLSSMFMGREASVARELALHYEAAGNWQLALTALQSAARHALERQSRAEAAQLLEHALAVAQNLSAADRHSAMIEIQDELAMTYETLNAGENPGLKASRKD